MLIENGVGLGKPYWKLWVTSQQQVSRLSIVGMVCRDSRTSSKHSKLSLLKIVDNRGQSLSSNNPFCVVEPQSCRNKPLNTSFVHCGASGQTLFQVKTNYQEVMYNGSKVHRISFPGLLTLTSHSTLALTRSLHLMIGLIISMLQSMIWRASSRPPLDQ